MTNKASQAVVIMTKAEVMDFIQEAVKQARSHPPEPLWVTTETAMSMLHIKSKSTLQKLRDSGAIEYSQHMKKIVLYKRTSILDYLESHSRKPF